MFRRFFLPIRLQRFLGILSVLFCCLSLTAHAEEQLVINPNAASVEALKALPNVDNKLAMAIVQYREMMGDIQTVDELKEIDGMTPEIFDAIKPHLSVESASTDCGC